MGMDAWKLGSSDMGALSILAPIVFFSSMGICGRIRLL